jgi:hypothetical protein
VAGAPAWAIRNNGLMLHSPSPKTMLRDQDFPIALEIQLLGGLGKGPRTTANLCTPGAHVVYQGKLHTAHCTNSTSPTYDGDQWVRAGLETYRDVRWQGKPRQWSHAHRIALVDVGVKRDAGAIGARDAHQFDRPGAVIGEREVRHGAVPPGDRRADTGIGDDHPTGDGLATAADDREHARECDLCSGSPHQSKHMTSTPGGEAIWKVARTRARVPRLSC